jgi:CARDB
MHTGKTIAVRALRFFICLGVALCFAVVSVWFDQRTLANDAPVGTYSEAVLQVTFSDQTDAVHANDLPALQQAAPEINSFYDQLSYRKLNFATKAARVKLGNTKAYYTSQCELDTTPTVLGRCTQLTSDAVAAEVLVDSHFFDGVDGVAILMAQQGRDFTTPPNDPGLGHEVQRSYLHEHPPLSPDLSFGPSHVQWASWVHEFGHQLQRAAELTMGGGWNGHPSGYRNGYDLMDSCYPCGQAPYGLLGPQFVNDNRGAFPGWLDASHVAVVSAPTGGVPVARTFVLAPLTPSVAPAVIQAVKIPIDASRYYMVNARARKGADTLVHPKYPTPTGIFQEGIQIELIDEQAEIPVTSCSGGGTGCVYQVSTPYPYPLWHSGQTLSDTARKIEIRTLDVVDGGYTVEIDRDVPVDSPDLFITPWHTPPMKTSESIDVWVDSSCNGYVVDGGELRYGRRTDGTVIGNGDDPCANHENRIYATVHNIGQAGSSPTTVTFYVTTPLGVGITGNWEKVGVASLPAVAPGSSAAVFVTWTPQVALSQRRIEDEHFQFHTCIKVVVDQDAGDPVTTNKTAQENIAYFEAVVDQGTSRRQLPKIDRTISLVNQHIDRAGLDYDPHRIYTLRAISHLPPGWKVELNGGKSDIFLKPNANIDIPVVITPAPAPAGQIYPMRVEAETYHWLTNPALPTTDPLYKHFSFGSVGDVEINAHTVYPTMLTLSAAAGSDVVTLSGALREPRPNVTIAIDITDSHSLTVTRLVKTDAAGDYRYDMKVPDNLRKSKLKVRSIWQGDMSYASAVSPLVSFTAP